MRGGGQRANGQPLRTLSITSWTNLLSDGAGLRESKTPTSYTPGQTKSFLLKSDTLRPTQQWQLPLYRKIKAKDRRRRRTEGIVRCSSTDHPNLPYLDKTMYEDNNNNNNKHSLGIAQIWTLTINSWAFIVSRPNKLVQLRKLASHHRVLSRNKSNNSEELFLAICAIRLTSTVVHISKLTNRKERNHLSLSLVRNN